MTERPSRARLLLFAFGDFAFNLYWQSVMLFLLFYYTDAIGLPIGIAATTYMVASIWDGFANFAAGALLDRFGDRVRYGALLVAGAVPLGLTFMLAYMPPPTGGSWAVAFIFIAHLLFRTAYAGVNVPYLAMTARISADGGDRSFVAGMRMLFGTGAAVVVALSTVPLGQLDRRWPCRRRLFRSRSRVRLRRRADPAAGRRHLPRSRNAEPAAAGQPHRRARQPGAQPRNSSRSTPR